MIRARFKTDANDYRPFVWPVKHPYWCTGSSETHSIVVAYADNLDELMRYWPDAEDVECEHASEYVFTDRFQKPAWFNYE